MSEIIEKVKSVRWQQVFIMLLMAALVVGADSCKSTGKMSKKERQAQIEAAKKQLQPIINGTSTMSYDEQKRIVGEIMDKNLNDPILNSMIVEAQQKLKALLAKETEAKSKKLDQARALLYDLLLNKDNRSADELEKDLKSVKAMNLQDTEIDELIGRVEKKIADMRAGGGAANLPVKTQLENDFNSIVQSAQNGDLAAADKTIQKTLQLFSSPDAPVLIIISREGSIVDYDKPTTIVRYLNLLRDVKANRNNVDAIMTDATGKIKGLDLIKK